MAPLIVVLLAVAATVSAVSNDLSKSPNPQSLPTLSSKGVYAADQKVNMSVLVANKNNICSNDFSKAPNPQSLPTLSSKDDDVADQKVYVPVLVANKNNICLGKIGKGDTLLAKATHFKKPCRNKVHVQDIIIKGQYSVGISAIQVTEVGATQNSVATVKEGGVGQNYVVIRLQSAKGCGYHYVTEVWGVKHKNNLQIMPLILISGS